MVASSNLQMNSAGSERIPRILLGSPREEQGPSGHATVGRARIRAIRVLGTIAGIETRQTKEDQPCA
jgi:hypothetical protein